MGVFYFFFQAEDGIRDLVRSRGLGDVYKRQGHVSTISNELRDRGWAEQTDDGLVVSDPDALLDLSLIHI